MSHKNVDLAFEKLNSCLEDLQEWMLSSMLESNPDKTEFIIFGSHVQLKKLDSNILITIFGNFIHLAVIVKNLSVWFDAIFFFADHIHNICNTFFIQLRDLRWVGEYLTDEAAILEANALMNGCLDY